MMTCTSAKRRNVSSWLWFVEFRPLCPKQSIAFCRLCRCNVASWAYEFVVWGAGPLAPPRSSPTLSAKDADLDQSSA
eukprot:2630993-Amphidinium_carterae.1